MLTLSSKEKIDYFELLLEIAPIGVMLLDDKGRIVELNKTASFEFNLAPQEAFGKNIDELFPKIERKRLQEFLSVAITLSGRSPYEAFQAKPKNDMARFFELTAARFTRKNKKGLLVTLRNISHTVSLISRLEEARRKYEEYADILADRESELERSKAQLETILEGGADAITVRDADWNLIYANRAALELYKLASVDELRGLPDAKVIREYEITDEGGRLITRTKLPGMESMRLKKRTSFRLCIKKKSEKEGDWWLVNSSPILDRDKSVRMVVNIFHSINAEMQEAKNREIFLGMASHELKTPLAVIKAFTQLAELRLKGKADPQVMEYLARIDDQVNRLSKLVRDLLDVTRIRSGKMEYIRRQFSPDKVIDRTVKELKATTDKHVIIKKGKIGKSVWGDEGRIEQVLTNLIRNAIKYSPKGGRILVKADKQDGRAIIEVQDFGIGIAPENQQEIFETYERIVSPKTKSIEGMGLGLYIAQAIVKDHKGDIWVESREGHGSRFFFALPIR